VERTRPDYYRVLQVDPAANPLVIQAAYRVLAQIWHPDVSGDDAEMKRLNAAWEVLGDPRRRRQYDIERAGQHRGVAEARPVTTPAPARPSPAPATGSRTADINAAFASHHAAQGAASASGAARTASTAPPAAQKTEDHAGTPVGEPFGPVLRFGRYEGWTLGQVSRIDRPFLEWLRSAPAGRGLKDEIDAVLRSAGISGVDRRRYDSDRQQQVHAWRPGAPTKVG
jgi:curved DNA-binding protein CbpA